MKTTHGRPAPPRSRSFVFWGLALCGLAAGGDWGAGAGAVGLSAQETAVDPVLDRLEDSIRTHLFTEPDRALTHARDFRAHAAAAGAPHDLARGENFVGLAHHVRGEIPEAIEAYLRALASFESLEDAWFVAMVKNNIGASYQVRRKPEEVLPWYEEALEGFRSVADTTWIANLLNNIAVQYVALDRLDEARAHQEEALDIHASRGDEASVHLLQGNLASTYLRLGELDRAHAFARSFLAHELAASDLSHLVNVLVTTARIHLARSEIPEARSAAETARSLSRDRGLREQEVMATAVLAEVQSAGGDYRLALETFRSFHALYDTLYSRDKDERITELLTQYDVARKDAAIELLEAEGALATRTQWAMGLGILLLLVVSVGALLLWRARLHRMRVLEEKNRTISAMLDEKEQLMREIHHRVKNNLQMISSLLQLQARHLSEPGAVAALSEGGDRVRSMAIIHHHLQVGEAGSVVDLPGYVESLCDTILQSYPAPGIALELEREVDDLRLDVSVMVPLGLVLNELLTNAIKYAFPGQAQGRILVRVVMEEDDLVLAVHDNGVGMAELSDRPESDADPRSGGFGTRMIRAFLPKLDADLEVQVLNGTRVTLRIRAWRVGEPALRSA